MSRYMTPATSAGMLGVAAAAIFVGAFAQEAMVTAVGAGLGVGGFILVFRPTLRSFILSFYR